MWQGWPAKLHLLTTEGVLCVSKERTRRGEEETRHGEPEAETLPLRWPLAASLGFTSES